ncbi:MAG: hypothetical protein ABIO29_04150 [Sphingomicrobium sp.]
MWSRNEWSGFFNLPKVNWSLFAIGALLILGGIIISPLPGPGGIFLIAPGMAFVLKSSIWAKRHYVRIKKWQPKAGRWMDWSLRRKSAARREAIRKAEKEAAALTPGRSDPN